jgi:predicted lipoprotein
MNLSKTLASTVAALTVAGGLGIAYAQTTSTPPATEGVTNTQSTTPDSSTTNTMNNGSMNNNSGSMNSSSTPSTDSSMSTTDSGTLPAQADRG